MFLVIKQHTSWDVARNECRDLSRGFYVNLPKPGSCLPMLKMYKDEKFAGKMPKTADFWQTVAENISGDQMDH